MTKTRQQVQTELRENELCAKVGRQLEKLYPGYKWFVQCTWRTGVVTVKNQNLHGDYGFVLHIKDLHNDVQIQALTMRAGGELLERCGLPAGPRPVYGIEVERDVRGNAKMDTHGAERK